MYLLYTYRESRLGGVSDCQCLLKDLNNSLLAGPQKILLFRLLPYFYNQAAYLHWLEGDNENENGIDSDSDNDNNNNHSDNLLVIMIVISY